MASSWHSEKGHLECHWFEGKEDGGRIEYRPAWMQQASDVRGSYLPPPPDFPSHSPFGGPSWFGIYLGDDSE